MKKIIYPFLIVVFFSIANKTHAQRTTEIGFNVGAARFYPEAKFFSSSRNNTMDNGFGWSAGLFLENHWNPKIHPVLELNYSSFSSDIFLEKDNFEPTNGSGVQPVSGIFSNTSFNYLSVSAGIKFYLNKKMFVYPGFEVAKPINNNVDLISVIYYSKSWDPVFIENRNVNKTNYNTKLGIGIDFNFADVMLEYSYGLNYQLSFFEYSNPFGINYRNNSLQLKVQVPLIQLK
jgi:hypothetical protein